MLVYAQWRQSSQVSRACSYTYLSLDPESIPMASRLQIVEFVSAASIKGVRVVVPCSLATSAPLPFLSLSLSRYVERAILAVSLLSLSLPITYRFF